MVLDEAFSFHERLEIALDVDWQLLHLPLVAAGAVSFLLVARRRVGHRGRLAVWFGGALAWAVSPALEDGEWDPFGRPGPGHAAMMVVEEVLEMVGSALWPAALVSELAVLTRDRSGDACRRRVRGRTPGGPGRCRRG